MPVDLPCYRSSKPEWLTAQPSCPLAVSGLSSVDPTADSPQRLTDLAAAVFDDLQEAELHALRDELKGLREREAARMAAMRAKASQEEAVAAEEEGVPPA